MRKVPSSWEDWACRESRPHQFRRHFPSEDYRVAAQDRGVRRRLGTRLARRRATAQGDVAGHRPGPGTIGAAGTMAAIPRDP